MSQQNDPYAGTTIGPDGTRVPVEEAEKQADATPESEKAIGGGEEVTEPTSETAETVGHTTVADAAVTGDLPDPDAERAANDPSGQGGAGDESNAGDGQGGGAQSEGA